MKQLIQFIVISAETTVFNIKSNKQVFLVSIATMAIAMSILGLFLVVYVNLNSFVSMWSKQVQLIIYLKDGIVKGEKEALENLISGNTDVETYNYISRKQAWENFQSSFAGKSGLISKLDFNPLPASYNLKFRENDDRLERIRGFAETLSGQSGVESLEYGEKWISRFENFMMFLRLFLLAVGGLLSLGLILIISNTIKLSIYSRQDEIELMLLIGATHRYIKIPLMLEGILQGLVGALIALGLTKIVHMYMKLQFQSSLETIAREANVQFLSQPLVVVLVVLSILIGWLGSYISINQFLNRETRK